MWVMRNKLKILTQTNCYCETTNLCAHTLLMLLWLSWDATLIYIKKIVKFNVWKKLMISKVIPCILHRKVAPLFSLYPLLNAKIHNLQLLP